MEFPKYRTPNQLTDEEILEVLKCVIPNINESKSESFPKIKSIWRSSQDFHDVQISIEYHECGEDYEYTYVEYFDLGYGIEADSFSISYEEQLNVMKKLLSLGVNELLKDNPYI